MCLCKIHVWHSCWDWSEDWSARQCFNFKSALLGWFPPLSPFHFAEKVSSSSPMPRCCPGKVRAKSELSPSCPQDREHLATCLVGSPGAQCLWTGWLPHRKNSRTVAILPFASMGANMKYIKGAYSLTPSLYPHQAIHPNPQMPTLHSSSSLPSLFVYCKNLLIKSNRLIFIGVSEAVHWTVWLRGKINAALSRRSNSICRFGLSHSVFITPK